MSDAEYCRVLSATDRRFRPGNIDEAAARAMSVCATEPEWAIPLLEDDITTMKVPLPRASWRAASQAASNSRGSVAGTGPRFRSQP